MRLPMFFVIKKVVVFSSNEVLSVNSAQGVKGLNYGDSSLKLF